jgi:hypothetical protein
MKLDFLLGSVHANDVFTPVDCSGRREDSCGISWTGETPQELAPRRLTASLAESEAPGTKINSLDKQSLLLNRGGITCLKSLF